MLTAQANTLRDHDELDEIRICLQSGTLLVATVETALSVGELETPQEISSAKENSDGSEVQPQGKISILLGGGRPRLMYKTKPNVETMMCKRLEKLRAIQKAADDANRHLN